MGKKKKILLILIACLTVVAIAVACIFAFLPQKANKNKILIEGVEDFHVPIGAMTDVQLLQNVTATTLEGTAVEVSVDSSAVDFNTPGKYSITYTADKTEKKASVYIYGAMTFQVGGQTLEGDKITIDFATAIGSIDFSKGVGVLDSFGNGVSVEKMADSDDFNYEIGEYTASYRATDRAGQILERTVTYEVISEVNMSVQENVQVEYAQESVSFKLDLDGESDIWLMDGKTMVPSADYSVSGTTLTLYANYYRSLEPGENSLKMCSQNGATEFVFTVVDTGIPIFSFDSLHTTKIIAGEATIYDKPQSLIKHHSYTYQYKFYGKAVEAGDSIAFQTSNGGNLSAGTYTVSVTAINDDQPNKKTTKSFKFRIYTNRAEVEGVELLVDLKGASLNLADLTNFGYPNGYDFKAKTQNSWDSRLAIRKLRKGVFSTISFDFYVYSCGIAEKENGPLNYSTGTAYIPFAAYDSAGNSYGIAYFDKSGKLVEAKDLKLRTWYTMKIDVGELAVEETDLLLHAGISNSRKIAMYIADVNAYAYQSPVAITEFKSSDGSLSIYRNGHKSSLEKTTYDGESVLRYTVSSKHIPQTELQRALKLKLNDSSKNVIRMDFMYQSAQMATGGDIVTRMYVSDLMNKNGRFGADYLVTDSDGNPVTILDLNKWYTLWVTTHDDKEFTLYPLGAGTSPIYAELLIKNYTALSAPVGGYKVAVQDGNNANVSVFQNGSEWMYGYASDTTIHKANTAWSRRFAVKLDKETYQRVSFQFCMLSSTFQGNTKLNLVALDSGLQIRDSEGRTVAAADMQLGVWYTAVLSNTDGSALKSSLDLIPLGYADGKAEAPVVVTMQIKDLQGSESAALSVYESADKTVSVKNIHENVEFTKNGDKIIYSAGNILSPEERSLVVNLLDTSKEVVKMNIQFTGDTEPVLAVYCGSSTARFIITDTEGNLVSAMEKNKEYTLWITTNGQSSFTLYPAKFAEGVMVTMELTVPETYDVEIGGVTVYAPNGNNAWMGLYLSGEEWQYGYLSDSAVHTANTAWNRRITMTLDGATYKELSFRFILEESTVNGVLTTNWKPYPSMGMQIKDANGATAEVTSLQTGIWYTATITNSGNMLPESIDFYTLGYIDGSLENPIVLKMQIQDLQVNGAETPGTPDTIPVYENADATASIQPFNINVGFQKDGDTITYSADSGLTAEQRSIVVKLLDSTKKVVKMNIKFTGNTTPTLGVYAGTKPGAYIITNAEGKLVSAMETNKEYTLWITTNDQTTYTLYPVWFNSGISATMELSVPETFAVEAGSATAFAPNGNNAWMGFYQSGEEWQYGYVSDSVVHTANTAWNRRFTVTLNSATYEELSFRFMLEESTVNGVLTTNWKPYPAMGMQIVDENGVATEATALQSGVWYKATITNSGNTLPESIDFYTLGYVDGSAENPVVLKMQIQDLQANGPETPENPSTIPVYENTDATASIQPFSINTSFQKNGEKILYSADSTLNAEQRSIVVKLLDTTKEVVKMNIKFTGTTDPILALYCGSSTARYVITDTEGKLVSTMEADKNYTLWIMTNGQSAFALYPAKFAEGVSATMELSVPETFDVETGAAVAYAPNGNNAWMGFYQIGDTWQYGYVSDTEVHVANTAWNRRFTVDLNAATYRELTFKFMLEESAVNGVLTTDWKPYPTMEMQIVDENGIAAEATALQTGVWYTATVTNSGNALPQTMDFYTLGYLDSGLETTVVLKMQIKDLAVDSPVETTDPPYINADGSASIQPYGSSKTIKKYGETIIYSASSSLSAEQRSIVVKLLDAEKDVVKMNIKFTNNTTPKLVVYTGATPTAYVITDADNNLVSTMEVNQEYTLWITANGQTDFVIYPVNFESGVSASMELSVPETFEVEDIGVTLTPNAGNYSCFGLYQVEEIWQYGYVSDTAIHGSNSADLRHFDVKHTEVCTEISFQIMLEESTVNGENQTNWKTYPTVGTQFVDENGTVVDVTALQTGVWYTVTFTNSGNNLPTIFDCYPLGWTNGNTSNPVKVIMQIKNLSIS